MLKVHPVKTIMRNLMYNREIQSNYKALNKYIDGHIADDWKSCRVNIIFCDIDGVFNSKNYYNRKGFVRYYNSYEDYYDDYNIKIFADFINNAQVDTRVVFVSTVISNSLNNEHFAAFYKKFRQYAPDKVIDGIKSTSYDKIADIQRWLADESSDRPAHHVIRYAIVDDADIFENSLFAENHRNSKYAKQMKKKFVKVNNKYGITMMDLKNILNVLRPV